MSDYKIYRVENEKRCHNCNKSRFLPTLYDRKQIMLYCEKKLRFISNSKDAESCIDFERR